MEKEYSEDSYCTTDEEGQDEMEKGYESDTEENKDQPGMIVKIKDDNIYKEILKVGEDNKKPSDIDNVVISSECFYFREGQSIPIPELIFKEQEFSLEDSENFLDNTNTTTITLPKALKVTLQTMAKSEQSKVFVKFNYILKHFDKLKNNNISLSDKINPVYFNEEFRNKMKDEKLIFILTLHNFFVCQNLMDRGEIKKKILSNGTSWRYARNPDTAIYHLSCSYNGKTIYERKNQKTELDKEKSLFEIEKRIIQNIKVGEKAEVRVKPSYMKDKNPEFLKVYEIDNTQDTIFICEVLNVEVYDYIFKPDKDLISKKRIIHKGFGRDSPDRESYVKCKMQVRIDSKIVYNNFELENIEEYISHNSSEYVKAYPEYRTVLNEQFKISQLDDDEDYPRDTQIFNLVDDRIKGLITIDLRDYTLPLIMRKVLIHMKRNEICYTKTNHVEFFSHDGLELNNFSGNVEIYIHLYEFLHREMFSKLSFEDKFKELKTLKEKGNEAFKRGKFFMASKIYQNLNYRFNDGQVFSNRQNETKEDLERIDKELHDKLVEIRLSSHTNLASCKFKLGKFSSTHNITKQILSHFDKENIKAMYLLGNSLVKLKMYDEAISVLTKLIEINPNCDEFKTSLKDAKELQIQDNQKQKNIYKKMLFSNN